MSDQNTKNAVDERTGEEIMNAMITSKIVEVTGNDATEAFIGKTVSKRNTASGVVYAIGDTGYVLSAAEYRMFAAAGAIASAVAGESAKKKASKKVKETVSAPKNKAKKMVAKAPAKARKKVSRAQTKGQARANTASNVAQIARDEQYAKPSYSFGDADTTGYLETSPFLLDYPEPEFNLDAPKHTGILDLGSDIGSKVSKFFDNLGARSRDKIVASIEGENEAREDEE